MLQERLKIEIRHKFTLIKQVSSLKKELQIKNKIENLKQKIEEQEKTEKPECKSFAVQTMIDATDTLVQMIDKGFKN